MEYYGNTLCISARELIDGGIVTRSNYQNWTNRGIVVVVRPGKGKGHYALIAVDSLPQWVREKVEEKYPSWAQAGLEEWVKSNYVYDQGAVAYFFNKDVCGVDLGAEKAREYAVNASVLNTCIRLYDRASVWQKLMGKKYSWEMMSATIEVLRKHFGHTLPASTLRFRKKAGEYRRDGYASLVSGKYGNQSARKVDHKTERLLLSIAVQPNKPWNTNVWEMYNSFVCGELDVWDYSSGELYDPGEWTDGNGDPLSLSESTVNNVLNQPKNQALISHRLESPTAFMHNRMPHMHRHAPEFSLSKVSFDDRDLPRKLRDSRQRPKAYYAYDVASGCCIGYAYNRSKNIDLVVEMFRNMFRLLDRHGWGCPAQVEVENHLMSQWRDSFLQAGVMFPFVRFCAPMNSQEKAAEQFNGAKKRSIEHKNHIGIGRFYARRSQYRTESVKVFDEANNTYVEKEYYTWDELIADDMRDIEEYNRAPHHNQAKYPGMSRWDVLVANINPTLQPIDKVTLARYIGEHVGTTIRRNSYCRVGYEDWNLSSVRVLEKLAPNNYAVDAYYLTDDTGKATDVFIFQNGRYVDTLRNLGTYNTAECEQTERDREIFTEQQKVVSEFRKYVEDNAIGSVGISKRAAAPKPVAQAVPEPAEVQEEAAYPAYMDIDYAALGRASL